MHINSRAQLHDSAGVAGPRPSGKASKCNAQRTKAGKQAKKSAGPSSHNLNLRIRSFLCEQTSGSYCPVMDFGLAFIDCWTYTRPDGDATLWHSKEGKIHQKEGLSHFNNRS